MKWDNKTKEIITYGFAFIALLFGFGISIAGFVVDPTGQLHDSVLWVLGQALVFAGAIIGVNLHIKRGMDEIQHHIKDEIMEHFKSHNDEHHSDNEDKDNC